MQVTETKSALMKLLAPLRLEGKRISFVPTMGALHRGHISLVDRARKECDIVVCSIFVNPTQFNNPGDLKNYPRTVKQDSAMLEKALVDIVFLPSVEEMYAPGEIEETFDFGMLDKVMEGAQRPGHFKGVAIIVSKLFEIVRPHKAYFGEKDFQQLTIIRELVNQRKSLTYGIEIIGCETVREQSGLAMSSRNMRLTEDERKEAANIYKALSMIKSEWKKSNTNNAEIINKAIKVIEQNGMMKVEYLEIADEKTLMPVNSENQGKLLRCFAAIQLGNVRLIDNMKLEI